MSTIRITRRFSFEMAHALEGYDGACSRVHGHSYQLEVTLRGRPATEGPKAGMVMDFGLLKELVDERIVSRFDHQLLERGQGVDFQPTCENLVAHFATLLVPALPAGVELLRLRLHETANSFAEWFAEDQARLPSGRM